MNKYRKIVYLWALSLICLLIFHFTIYYIYTSKVYLDPNEKFVGDLGRTSYMIDMLFERETNEIDLAKQHIKFTDFQGQNVDMLTIGDSFSNGMGFGLNRYYQDYIATLYNIDILNIPQLDMTDNFIETISLLANSNYLKKIGVKYVLIEAVQRSVIESFAKENIDFTRKLDIDFTKVIQSAKDTHTLKGLREKRITIINNLNMNALKYNLKYFINGHGKISSFYREKLSESLFTTKANKEILFYHDDIKKLSYESNKNINLVNHNLNILAKKLARQNIKLIFMPAVDKYTLYRNYIISNTYPESVFFEYLRGLDKEYIFVDTKSILLKKLDNNVKDLFYSDDTHWSYKASETIVKSKIFKNLFLK